MRQPMAPAEKKILVVTCFGHFITHFNMLVFPALVLPLAGRLGLEVPRVLELSFWMYLLFGLSALPWGLAADRWGAKHQLMLFFLGSGICGLAAAWWLDNPPLFSLALAGLGLFAGIYHPAGLGMISKGVSQVSMAMGYNGMFGNLGLALAPFLTGIVNWLAGPRAAYLVLAGLNFAGLALMALAPMDYGHQAEAPSKARAAKGSNPWLPFIVLLGAMTLGGIAYRGSGVIMPTLFELRGRAIYDFLAALAPGGFSQNLVATMVTSLVYLLGVVAQYIGGRVGSRFELRKSYLLFHAASVPAALLAGWLSGGGLLLAVMAYMFFLLGMQPIENTLVSNYTPARLRHAAYGTKFIFVFGVGSLAVMLAGAVEGAWGVRYVFPVLGLVSLLLVGCILALIKVTSPSR